MHWIALQPQPDAAPGELTDTLAALGWWALQFTPRVARCEGAVLLEVSASARLWGGLAQLLDRILASNTQLAPVNHAQGATSLIAFARLQSAALVSALPDDLPLTCLAAARPHLATLQKIGCTHWGQLRALPRGGVVRRFGASLLQALDQAYGLRPDVFPWLVLPDVFESTLELSAQVDAAPALLFGARRLLGSLQVWLQLRHCGVLAVELRWTLDARRSCARHGGLVVRTAEPTADMAHLARLLAEHLAQVTLPAPVLYLRLRSLETQQLPGRSASLLPHELSTGDSLHQLLERLSARLGAQQVQQWQANFDHRPERMQTWHSAENATQLIATCEGNTSASGLKHAKKFELYPTWLLARPLRLAVRRQQPLYLGPLTLLAGPQRIEAGWWGGGDCALRDYFVARSAQAGLLWVYRERLAGHSLAQGASNPAPEAEWYLHGLFA